MSRSSRLHWKSQRNVSMRVLSDVVMIVAFVEPLITIGQIVQLWRAQDAKGNSLLTWSFFLFSAVIWLIYGLKIKNKPLIISSFLWVITEGIVVAEILYFS